MLAAGDESGEGASETAATAKGRQRARKSPKPHSSEASVRLSFSFVVFQHLLANALRVGGGWSASPAGASHCVVVTLTCCRRVVLSLSLLCSTQPHGDHVDPQRNDAVMVFVVLLCCG